jgi:hypothetical protein
VSLVPQSFHQQYSLFYYYYFSNCIHIIIYHVFLVEELLELHLYDSNITSLRDVCDLHLFINLQVLNLHSNHISKIENLSTLVHLRELNLSSNDIVQMEGLHRLGKLEVLNLASNRIKEVSGLEGMGNLRRVNLSFNQIVSIEGFSVLNGPHSRLHYADLRGNRIGSLDELCSLSRCQSLRFLVFQMEPRSQSRGNPVCSLAGYQSHAFKTIPSLFSLDGFDINRKPVHESDEQDPQNFPSLAPYIDFLPEQGVRRAPSSALSDTPLIDQVLQRHSSRRPLSARHQPPSEPPKGGDKNNRQQRLEPPNKREAERDNKLSPSKSRQGTQPARPGHEERLSKLEAQLARRLSVRQDKRATRSKLRSDDSESSVSIDEDFSSTGDETSVAASLHDERIVYRPHDRTKNNEPEEPLKKEPTPKISTHTQGMQTDPLSEIDIGDHPTVKALYEEIGSLQKELEQRDAELQQALNCEASKQEPVRALQTSIQHATVREHGLREALAREKELVQRQTHQITSLHHQVNELGAQLRTARECADKAEDQRRELQSTAESLRAVCDAEKGHNKQKDTQIERLTALLRERHGEALSHKGKEGELQVELERAQVCLTHKGDVLFSHHLQAQLAVYQREADDVRELKQELMVHISQEASVKEENMKMQHLVSHLKF